MNTKIKINSDDELKIIKSVRKLVVPPKQIHKNKKAYSRQGKHKEKNYNI